MLSKFIFRKSKKGFEKERPTYSKAGLPYRNVGLLGDDPRDDFGVLHPGQADVQALVLDREALVVDAKVVKDCGVEVTDVDGILDDVVGVIVRFAVVARFEPAPYNAGRKATAMVVAAVVVFRELALAVDGAAELATKDDNRIFQHPAFFQFLDEGGGGLVNAFAIGPDVLG